MTRKIVWPPVLVDAGTDEDGNVVRKLATHRQDSLAEIAQSVRMAIRTPLGQRALAPDLGFDDPTFDTVEDHDLEQLGEWEPRAVLDVTVTASPGGNDVTRRIEVDLADNPDRRGVA